MGSCADSMSSARCRIWPTSNDHWRIWVHIWLRRKTRILPQGSLVFTSAKRHLNPIHQSPDLSGRSTHHRLVLPICSDRVGPQLTGSSLAGPASTSETGRSDGIRGLLATRAPLSRRGLPCLHRSSCWPHAPVPLKPSTLRRHHYFYPSDKPSLSQKKQQH